MGLLGHDDDVWATADMDVAAIRVAKTVNKPFLGVKRKDIDLLRFMGCFKTILKAPIFYLLTFITPKSLRGFFLPFRKMQRQSLYWYHSLHFFI